MMSRFSRRNLLKGFALVAAGAVSPAIMLGHAQAQSQASAVDAVRLALAKDYAGAGVMAQQSGDSAAIKLVEMLYLRDKPAEAGYARVSAFLNGTPGWPLRETLQKRAEQALYETSEPAPTILAHFQNTQPASAHGALALARACFATGDTTSGQKWLRRGWLDATMPADLERRAATEFAVQLNPELHKARLWQLVFAQQSSSAERHAASYLSADYRSAAKVAGSLHSFDAGAKRNFDGLPAGLRGEMAMLFALARWQRKYANYDAVRGIIAKLPVDASALGNATAWFEERRTIVRRSVGPFQVANYKTAYAIAKNHGVTSGDFASEGEFLAGWVALRYLGNAQLALPHFQKLLKLAESGTDTARAQYWLGRAHAASGTGAAARLAYQAAAKHSTLYYGQLAREELGQGTVPEEIAAGKSSEAAKADIEKDELVRAMRLVALAGTKNQINIFLLPLTKRYDDLDHLNAAANVVNQIGGTAWALRFAKAAALRGKDLDAWSYPINGLPNWQQVGKPVEKPLVFALSRQESEFDPDAGSSVGAQGLMQVMPGTARLVAQQIGIAYQSQKLKDATYNVRLGSAFLGSLVERFKGSYVLSLVAYNAGPLRATEWVAAFGDPRGGRVNAVDFVECIPFNETRQYVQKVLQNLHVYRSRLEPSSVRPMSVDLKRGQAEDVATASTGVFGLRAN